MKSNKTASGRILKGLREFANALENGEPIAQKFTCRTIKLDLHPAVYTPRKVKATRALLQVSQAVFAQFIGVKASRVRSWELGAQTPSEMAARFMDESAQSRLLTATAQGFDPREGRIAVGR